jgi:hypothetical protein
MSNGSGEVERILNCLPSTDTEEDWAIEDALAAGAWDEPVDLPESVDLRESWWKIGDQGGTGSCVGWATADSVIRWHFKNAGRIAEGELLSVRYIWMAAKETDEFGPRPTGFIEKSGTSLKAALDVARGYGVVRDPVLAFSSGQLSLLTAKQFYILASQLRIANYLNLGRELSRWRDWLATDGPILTRLDVDETWWRAKETKGNLDEYHHPGKPAGHAVALVGYTPDRFIVRNSWGTERWGDEGFGYASEEYAEKAFTEAYGVVV